MKLSDYSYNLPQNLIADRPPTQRGGSRLLVLDRHTGSVEDNYYRNLADLIQPGDIVVVNVTKVIPARLMATTEAGANRELLLLEKHGHDQDEHRMRAMHRGKLKAGQALRVGATELKVEEVLGDGTAVIAGSESLIQLAEDHGTVPLPPYMHRSSDAADIERYQTVFAKENGSVAAPTASLNLTPEILGSLKAKGAEIHELTLHVGLGTFMPIREDDITRHDMHQEYFEIPAETGKAIQEAKATGHRVVAVGTTVTRALEFSADQLLADSQDISGEANIFIYPDYQFKIVDALLTNFHAPDSTVLMMAAAFAGWDNLHQAYEHAIAEKYKFLSYGDSMFVQ